jgi:hypothetical protein
LRRSGGQVAAVAMAVVLAVATFGVLTEPVAEARSLSPQTGPPFNYGDVSVVAIQNNSTASGSSLSWTFPAAAGEMVVAVLDAAISFTTWTIDNFTAEPLPTAISADGVYLPLMVWTPYETKVVNASFDRYYGAAGYYAGFVHTTAGHAAANASFGQTTQAQVTTVAVAGVLDVVSAPTPATTWAGADVAGIDGCQENVADYAGHTGNDSHQFTWNFGVGCSRVPELVLGFASIENATVALWVSDANSTVLASEITANSHLNMGVYASYVQGSGLRYFNTSMALAVPAMGTETLTTTAYLTTGFETLNNTDPGTGDPENNSGQILPILPSSGGLAALILIGAFAGVFTFMVTRRRRRK